jgi:hypothetical protein
MYLSRGAELVIIPEALIFCQKFPPFGKGDFQGYS